MKLTNDENHTTANNNEMQLHKKTETFHRIITHIDIEITYAKECLLCLFDDIFEILIVIAYFYRSSCLSES